MAVTQRVIVAVHLSVTDCGNSNLQVSPIFIVFQGSTTSVACELVRSCRTPAISDSFTGIVNNSIDVCQTNIVVRY